MFMTTKARVRSIEVLTRAARKGLSSLGASKVARTMLGNSLSLRLRHRRRREAGIKAAEWLAALALLAGGVAVFRSRKKAKQLAVGHAELRVKEPYGGQEVVMAGGP